MAGATGGAAGWTSGGMAWLFLGAERPPADVPPAEAVGPIDTIDRPIGAVTRLAQAGANRGHVQDPAAVADQLVSHAFGAGVEDRHALDRGGLLEAADRRALLIGIGIAARGHHDGDRRLV